MRRRPPHRLVQPPFATLRWRSAVVLMAGAAGIFLSIAIATGWWIDPEVGSFGTTLTPPCPAPRTDMGGWQVLRSASGEIAMRAPRAFRPERFLEDWPDQWSDGVTHLRFTAEAHDPGPPHMSHGVSHGLVALERCRERMAGQDAWIASGKSIGGGEWYTAQGTVRLPDGRFVTAVSFSPDLAGQAVMLAALRTIRILPADSVHRSSSSASDPARR